MQTTAYRWSLQISQPSTECPVVRWATNGRFRWTSRNWTRGTWQGSATARNRQRTRACPGWRRSTPSQWNQTAYPGLRRRKAAIARSASQGWSRRKRYGERGKERHQTTDVLSVLQLAERVHAATIKFRLTTPAAIVQFERMPKKPQSATTATCSCFALRFISLVFFVRCTVCQDREYRFLYFVSCFVWLGSLSRGFIICLKCLSRAVIVMVQTLVFLTFALLIDKNTSEKRAEQLQAVICSADRSYAWNASQPDMFRQWIGFYSLGSTVASSERCSKSTNRGKTFSGSVSNFKLAAITARTNAHSPFTALCFAPVAFDAAMSWDY